MAVAPLILNSVSDIRQCPQCGATAFEPRETEGGLQLVCVSCGEVPSFPAPEMKPEAGFLDLFEGVEVTTPVLLRDTELMQSGAARPEKAGLKPLPGMRSKVVRAPARRPAETPPATRAVVVGADPLTAALTHPLIGGRLTVCVYCSEQIQAWPVIRRCLTSVQQTVPASALDLRIAAEQPGIEIQNGLNAVSPVSVLHVEHRAIGKYQVMRKLWYGEGQPPLSNWIAWFDAAAYVKQSGWLLGLCRLIIEGGQRGGLIGAVRQHVLQPLNGKDPRRWFRSRPWWKDGPLQDAQGRESANGDHITYVDASFFAISRDAARAAGAPDSQIVPAGGEICLGIQMQQAGFPIIAYNARGDLVCLPPPPRVKPRLPWYHA